MITSTDITKGMAPRGTVAHAVKGVGTFGLPVSYCGRWVTPGDCPDARLCKTCVRVGKITEVKPLESNEARRLIAECGCWRSVHMSPETFVTGRLNGEEFTAFEISMFRDVVEDFTKGLENDACWVGTCAILVKDPKLTQEVKPVESKRSMPKGDGMVNPKAHRSAFKGTDKQLELIRNIARQMDEIDDEMLPKLEIPIATHAELVEDGIARVKSVKDASTWIKRLFETLDTKKAKLKEFRANKRAEESKTNPAEDGFYILGDTFVTVKWNRAKTGQYATVWSHDTESWEYDGRKSYALVQDVKAGKLARVTEADAARFGELYGRCMRCSRTLTDPDSILESMGKVCRSKMGF